MSGCKAKWLTFGKSRVRVRGKSTSFPHFAYILSLAPSTESHVILLGTMTSQQTGKSLRYINHTLAQAWPVLCTALQKHGPDWKAKYERRFCNRDVPDFGHHFSYKRYVFSIVSSSEMITIQIEFFALTHAWSFFAREALSDTEKRLV